MKLLLGLLCASALTACCFIFPNSKIFGGCYVACYRTYFQPVIYPPPVVTPNVTTLAGFRLDVDLVKWNLDLVKLDQRLLAIESCVNEVKGQQQGATVAQLNAWGCPNNRRFEVAPIKKDCLVIKVMDPVPSKCQSEWQLLPAPAPDALCAAKGLKVTPECPCLWRSGTIDDYKVITPPRLYLWPVVEIITSCNNLWGSPFARCLML